MVPENSSLGKSSFKRQRLQGTESGRDLPEPVPIPSTKRHVTFTGQEELSQSLRETATTTTSSSAPTLPGRATPAQKERTPGETRDAVLEARLAGIPCSSALTPGPMKAVPKSKPPADSCFHDETDGRQRHRGEAERVGREGTHLGTGTDEVENERTAGRASQAGHDPAG